MFVLADLSGLHCRQKFRWVAGPSLTPHTKPRQDVVVQIRSRRLLQKLSSLTFHAEHDSSGLSGRRKPSLDAQNSDLFSMLS